ncbi:MAG TPA: hypothetical protein VFX96_04015 [Pyrinomonadaceae bacterium]|nr:hypothetical protein [Pyrinomonadaceae bacterium]
MFLRFVGAQVDRNSHVRGGIFMAATRLRDSGSLPDYEFDALMSLAEWFDENLERPTKFSRSKGAVETYRAVCWFKSTARAHISKAWELVSILERNDVLIDVVKSARVGYVVYEDDFQVAAEPFYDRRY